MIVIDASALASFILLEPGWDRLAPYMKNGVTIDHAIKEVLNAIWKAQHRGLIGVKDAKKKASILVELTKINIRLFDEKMLVNEAFDISLRYKITIYDALYIALALKRRLPLLTLDEIQASVAEQLGLKVISQKSYP